MNTYENINTAFIDSLSLLNEHGNKLTIRGTEVIELMDYSFKILNPTKRVLTCPYRYNNIFAIVAETLWVFSGRDDMGFLTYFLPNAINYSDDGKTWRAGYGPRLRYFNSDPRDQRLDQINNVIETLKEDPFSRQAIIVIPIADYDYDESIHTKDRPCTIFIQFLIRNGKLHCFARFRSQDAIWGTFNINVFEWTFLQEVIAGMLNIPLGYYHHNGVSFHYYSTMEKRVNNIISSKGYNVYRYYEENPTQISMSGSTNITHFNDCLAKSMNIIEDTGATPLRKLVYLETANKLIGFYTRMCMAYKALKEDDPIFACELIIHSLVKEEMMPYVVASLEYIYRYIKKSESSSISKKSKLIERIKDLNIDGETFKYITGDWDE